MFCGCSSWRAHAFQGQRTGLVATILAKKAHGLASLRHFPVATGPRPLPLGLRRAVAGLTKSGMGETPHSAGKTFA